MNEPGDVTQRCSLAYRQHVVSEYLAKSEGAIVSWLGLRLGTFCHSELCMLSVTMSTNPAEAIPREKRYIARPQG